MDLITDVISIILNGLGKLSAKNLYLTLGSAVILSVSCFFGCNYYSHLWNKTYQTTLTHKVLSGIASLFTFLFVLAFVAFTFWEEVATTKITIWKERLKNDSVFINKCFYDAYYAVKALNIEDFTDYPSPENGGRIIPMSNEKSQLTSGEIYSKLACQNFDSENPLLGLILQSDFGIAPELIKEDTKRHFAAGGTLYLVSNGVEIAATVIKKELTKQAPRVVTLARTILVLLFIIIQIIPFGLIGFAAYKDLKIKV